jgi:hypothetical protein
MTVKEIVVDTSSAGSADSSFWIYFLFFLLLALCFIPLVASYPTYRIRIVEDVVEYEDGRKPKHGECEGKFDRSLEL